MKFTKLTAILLVLNLACLGAVGLALRSLPREELSLGFARAMNDFGARYANH